MVDKNRIIRDVSYLTAIDPPRNYKHPESLKKIADYINASFQKDGLETERQHFEAKNNEYENIIGSYGPDKTRRLIVGAHYDVAGDHPGADDNASGIAGLLELGRLLAQNKPVLDYRIDLVAYGLEEPPFYGTKYMGSAIHAKSLKENDANVIGMVCMDMIGFFSSKPGSQKKPFEKISSDYTDTGDFIAITGLESQVKFVNNICESMKNNFNIIVKTALSLRRNGYAALSDHRNYWKQGYNALVINDTAFLRNPNYHNNQDTIDTLDFDKMEEVIKGVYFALISIVIVPVEN